MTAVRATEGEGPGRDGKCLPGCASGNSTGRALEAVVPGMVGENRGGMVVVQDRVDDTLQRVGLAALIYYPELHVDEPEYAVADDVDWCLEPLNCLPAGQLESLRDVVGRTIVDPTAHRAGLFAALRALVPDGE